MTFGGGWRGAVLAGALLLVACGGHAGAATAGSAVGARAAAPQARASATSAGDWPRFDYNAQRTGVGPSSTGITAANVGSLAVRTVQLDGTADSSAIELHSILVAGRTRDVIIVTTTYGKTIALDPGSGAKLWEFVPGDIGGYQGSAQVTTATPIADPDRRYVYAASPDGFIHKLTVAGGRQVWARRITFDPSKEKIASALNFNGGAVIAVTGGYYGDAPVYQGHLVTIDARTGQIRHVWNSLCSQIHHLINPPSSCSQSDSAIWARAGAVVEPGSGRLLVATGNGDFNGSTDWGDSVLELSADGARLLHNWTPTDQASLNANDTDLGSTAPALLPTTGGYRLAVQGGKDGRLHLLNLNRLNGTRGGAGGRLGGEVSEISAPGGEVFTAPAVWSHGGQRYVFVATDGGTATYALRTAGHPHLSVQWHNGTPGTSPVLAGGLLYVYDEVNGSLNVYDPTSGHALASLAAAGGHWNSPIVVGGRVILPVGNYMSHATSGQLEIYHLPGR